MNSALTAPNGSPFDQKKLPAWEHQPEFDSIVARYLPLARQLPAVVRLLQIKGTTANYCEAISHGLPEALNADLYRKFISGNSALSPIFAVAADIRDSQ